MRRSVVVIAIVLVAAVIPVLVVRAPTGVGPPVADLPTSGSPFDAIRAAADEPADTPDLTCDQDSRQHPKVTLASALVYAATGDEAYRQQAEALIREAYPTARSCENAILSLGRQLGAYVLAADYIAFDDPGFDAWLTDIRTADLGGHSRWFTLRRTAGNTSSNWGIFALASIIAADAYLRDRAALRTDWQIFVGYGDGSWSFEPTNSYQPEWNCDGYRAIEPGHCGSPDQNGAPVEDASREDYPEPHAGYVNEAMQGYVLQALLLEHAGFPAWEVNDAQICRAARFQERYGITNDHETGHYVGFAIRERCPGSAYPLPEAAGYGRVFGFTDWLLGPG